MEIQEIIAKLETFNGTFPKEALEAAIAKKEEIIPELLEVLNKVIQDAEGYALKSDYILHTHALYLLAQFREKQAYPVIYKFFSIPTIELLIGESHIEQAGRILASVSNGDLSLIKELIENPDVYEYARSSSIDALIVLMVNGELSRELVIEYFAELFDSKLERKQDYIWNGLIATCLDLNMTELLDKIKEAFSSKFVLETLTLDEVIEAFELNKKDPIIFKKDDYPNTFIDSVIEEMEYLEDVLEDDEDTRYNEPVRTEPKIGRNQPCFCGSGKKYKKCCGKN
jgi:hypothetical protein